MIPRPKIKIAECHTKSSPRPQKTRVSSARVKIMIIIFFGSLGIVHKEFVSPGQTANHDFYKDVLQ
jgi:hypothetical protein